MYDQITLEFKPSVYLCAFIVLPCVAAIILVGTRNTPLLFNFALSLAILGGGAYYTRLYALLNLKQAIHKIKLSQKTLTIFNSSHHASNVTLHKNSFISPWFCILNFSITEGKTKACIVLLCKHNIRDQDSFRRFRVWSKYGEASSQEIELF